jgi:SAM-dependent methyltransferase
MGLDRATLRRKANALPRPVQAALRRTVRLVRRRWPYPLWGNLRRAEPFSDSYGQDRGTPADRVYLRRFVLDHAAEIRGAVLEIERPEWSVLAASGAVTRLELLDLDPANRDATIICDLAEGPVLGGPYDCAIVLQTLQYVSSPAEVLRNLYDALAPGGVLLVSCPVISRLDYLCGPTGDLWRFTPSGLRRLVVQTLPSAEVEVTGYGNLAVATAFLQGLSAEEAGDRAYVRHDDRFPITACAAIRRPQLSTAPAS